MNCNSILLCFLFAIAANSFTAAKAQAVDTKDSLALVDLYNSTNGNHWNNHTKWLTKAPVSKWFGIEVSGTRVITIYLADNALTGTLPSSVGNLTGLTKLDLFRNQLTGIIPASIGNLTSLVGLDLFDNGLSGAIPASIGNLASLNFLYLDNNQLTGSIPFSIGNLSNLSNLSLADNKLTGVIPASLSNLTYLNYLALSFNQLSGNIPASLAKIQLLNVYLNNNQLSGDLSSVAKLKSLNHLDVSYNNMSGDISPVVKLQNLYYLNLSYNQFSGNIPASVKQLVNIYFIDISHNRLTKSKNVSFNTHTNKGDMIDVSYNDLTFDGLESLVYSFKHPVYNPQAPLSIHQQGNVLSVYAGGTLSNNTYNWYKAGEPGTTTITGDSTFNPTASGKYYVTVSNAIATQLTLYSDTVEFIMPAAKQSSSILIAKTVQPATAAKHMLVYPNPAKDVIHIQTNGKAIITLINSAGKILLTKTINNNSEVNISAFANGTYYLQNKTTGETHKIVVMH